MTEVKSKKGGAQPGAGRPTAISSDAVKRVRQSMPTEGKVRLGWSQEKMARELGCSTIAVRVMEKEEKLPTDHDVLANFRRLAKLAGVEVPELGDGQ